MYRGVHVCVQCTMCAHVHVHEQSTDGLHVSQRPLVQSWVAASFFNSFSNNIPEPFLHVHVHVHEERLGNIFRELRKTGSHPDMHMCIYTCMYIYMYVYIHVCMLYMYMYMCTYQHTAILQCWLSQTKQVTTCWYRWPLTSSTAASLWQPGGIRRSRWCCCAPAASCLATVPRRSSQGDIILQDITKQTLSVNGKVQLPEWTCGVPLNFSISYTQAISLKNIIEEALY